MRVETNVTVGAVRLSLLLATVCSGLWPEGAAAHADNAVDIGSRIELFVDRFLIERMEDVELRLNHPIVCENVFQFDAPWEGVRSTYVTVFQDDKCYRMYYRGSSGLFMSSRDGLNFQRWPEAFMRPGLEPENWTPRNNMAAWGILELRPGEISVYYSQHYDHPTNHLVRATLRTDGFVSACAGANGGEMLTKPLIFDGRELIINYSTSAAGNVQAEIQNEDENAIAGFRMEECPVIYGDEIERVVRWNAGSDVSALAGKTVRLRFKLQDADLYSFRFHTCPLGKY